MADAGMMTDWGEQTSGRLGWVAAVLVFAGALTPFLVSSMLLTEVGIPYDEAGGSPLTKVHPATYLAVFAFIAYAFAKGDPLRFCLHSARRFPSLILFMPIFGLLIAWTIVVQKSPVTSRLDTFLPPALMLVLIADLSEARHRLLTTMLHAVLNINALIGIFEVATGLRLTPFTIGGEAMEWEWRATALLGHPLDNALITGLYLLALHFGADRAIPTWLRLSMMSLQTAGLVAFGGRTALVGSLGLIALSSAGRFVGVLRGGRFDARLGAAVIVVIPLALAALIGAFELGLFDKLAERFTNDSGSANTRVVMLRILASFSWHDLLMGPDQEILTERMWIEGSFYGIESFVIGFFLQSGLIVSFLLFFGLAVFSADLWRIGSRNSIWLILYFFAVSAGAASLSVKTQSLIQFVVIMATIEARPSRHDMAEDEPLQRE